MKDNKLTVLACPLDWGLGHASRMVPLIRQMIFAGYHVILAGNGNSLALLLAEFPTLEHVLLPSMTVRYSAGSTQLFKILSQIPRLLSTIRKEHRHLRRLIALYPIDILISDNRYGLHNQNIHTILITHQISPILPVWIRLLEYPLYVFIRMLVSKFDECWIPDFASGNHNLTGDLSHRFRIPANTKFIGLLSRFAGKSDTSFPQMTHKYELVVMLSGPEPQKSILYDLIMRQLQRIALKTIVVGGFSQLPELTFSQQKYITCVSHMPTDQLFRVLLHADVIICRPGYSGIMDLVALKKPAILIPTPGQPEQEYLAAYITQSGFFVACKQKNFNLKTALETYKEKSRQKYPFDFADEKGQIYINPGTLNKKNKHNTSESKQEPRINL